ncbi:MAG TPA: hypothetical protein VM695_16890 [Phycisphaerae bacterium]|nr:hypothetical protein [Phycisphaerae bacterium]
MKAFVVDTNVAVVANGRAEQAGQSCVLACVEALRAVRRGRLVIDDALRILTEYRKNLRMSGEGGPGNAFMRWAWDKQLDPARCENVAITPKAGAEDDFQEFPDDPALRGFDRSDRKFVAVALASSLGPEVLNATDSDWWDYREPLRRHGAKLCFVCPEQFHGRP